MRSMSKGFASRLSLLALAALGLGFAPNANAGQTHGCSLSSLRGAYAVKLDGVLQVPSLPERKINLIASVTFDGAGKFNATVTGRINGDPVTGPFAGVYSLASDCNGALDLTQVFKGFSNVQADIIAIERGKELFLVIDSPAPPTNPAIIQVSGVAKRLRSED